MSEEIQFVIGPYQPSDNRPEIWKVPRNQGSSSTGTANRINYEQLSNEEADSKFEFQVRNIRDPAKIKIDRIIDVSSNNCKKQAKFYTSPKYLWQTMRDVFSTITGIRDNWPRKSDLVWGFPKADVFQRQIPIMHKNDKPDENKDFPRRNGMMTIYEVETYLKNYYGKETYMQQAARLKWGMVMSIRFDIRMRQLAKLYPDQSSLFYHLIGFYHTQDRLDNDKNMANTFTFSKKYNKYVDDLFPEIDDNMTELVRMLPFYIVRTSPQFFRTGGIEGLSLGKGKKKPIQQDNNNNNNFISELFNLNQDNTFDLQNRLGLDQQGRVVEDPDQDSQNRPRSDSLNRFD
tara:strand:- start:147 stop:1181 length:1035 start_codon:yes stop_codon:yes gene_type:complete